MKSIRLKLIVSFFVILAFNGGLIGISTYYNWFYSAEDDAIELSSQALASKRDYLESYMDEWVKTTQTIWFSSYAQKYIAVDGPIEPLLYNRVSDLLTTYTYIRPYMEGILLYRTDGEIVKSGGGKVLRDDLTPLYSYNWPADTKPRVLSPHNQEYYYNGSDVFSIVRGISFDGNPHPNHYLMVDISMKLIENTMDTPLEKSGYFAIVDTEGRYVYHPDHAKIGQMSELNPYGDDEQYGPNHGRLMVTHMNGETSGWTYYGVIPYSSLLEGIVKNRDFTILIVIVSGILAIMISYILSTRITKPMVELRSKMSQVKKGNFSAKVKVSGNDEIADLSESFNVMVEELERTRKEVYLAKIRQTEADMKMLQSQINPHFLYNSLEFIHSVASLEGIGQIEQMVSALSRLFRYNVGTTRRFVEVREELEYVNTYLNIQKIRFQDRFDITINVDPNLEHMKILKFILQPLIENAYSHGLEKKQGKGQLHIDISPLESGGISIMVEDNGIGISEERMNQIQGWFEECEEGNPVWDNLKSIGLVNVYHRLRLNYGDRFRFLIQSESCRGTSIEIQIWDDAKLV